LAKTQEQLSTGKQITKPSDEPDKASLVTRLESEIARQKSYQGNIKSIEIRLMAGETALTSTSNVMFRMKELAVQAANDTLGPADRRTISLEMTQLRDQIVSLANSQDSNGNFCLLARVSQMPFSPDAKGVIVYKGDQARMVVGKWATTAE
jgi:flagellar hook-associated protein 3 FlgL